MGEQNWSNKTIFTGDNLPIMRRMNSESVDLIYLDPPFNSNVNYAAPIGSQAAGAAFKDSWSLSDIDLEWLYLLKGKHPRLWHKILAADRKSDRAYLIYMTPRLIEMHRILRPTGCLYLHCDSTMSHYLKVLLDGVFNRGGFRNEIIWQRHFSLAKGSQHAPKSWGTTTDSLLYYAKSKDAKIKPYREMTEAERIEQFPKVDEKGRRYYLYPLWGASTAGARPNLCYEWRGYRNPHARGWRLSRERLEEEYQKGNIVIKPGGRLERRKYEKDGQAGRQYWGGYIERARRREHGLSHPETACLARENYSRIERGCGRWQVRGCSL